MLTFMNMNVVGFCSIENLHISLNPSCTILIKAPNGKGKSTILSALVWAIYGKNLKGVSEVTTWEKVRPKDYSGVMVEVYFQKNEHIYKIIRCQKCDLVLEDGVKGKDRLIFLKDNELVNVKGKNKLQDTINAELGLSYTLFMNLKKDREDLTKQLIKKQQQLKDEVEQSLKIKIKKHTDYVDGLKSKIKHNRNISGVSLPDFVKKLKIQLDKGHYKRAKESVDIIYKAIINSDKLQEEYEDALGRLDELRTTNEKYKRLQKECDDIASDIASIDEDLEKLKREKLKVMSPKYKEKLKEIRKNLRKVDEDYHNKELELKNYDWLLNDPLGNNGIKAYLFDSSLDMLNRTLDKYSQVLGFRIEFGIDLGTIRKDFYTLIERDGQIIDYNELSGGERQLCNVAMAFAMNESLTASKGINLAFLDEVFESLSSDNVEVVTSLIRHTFANKTLFLITHLDSLPLSNTKILQVEKVNGLSRYQLL